MALRTYCLYRDNLKKITPLLWSLTLLAMGLDYWGEKLPESDVMLLPISVASLLLSLSLFIVWQQKLAGDRLSVNALVKAMGSFIGIFIREGTKALIYSYLIMVVMTFLLIELGNLFPTVSVLQTPLFFVLLTLLTLFYVSVHIRLFLAFPHYVHTKRKKLQLTWLAAKKVRRQSNIAAIISLAYIIVSLAMASLLTQQVAHLYLTVCFVPLYCYWQLTLKVLWQQSTAIQTAAFE
ncbi:hypothetical protein [Polycladidibacter stylochi]|uniref:hypothetical protein n=1 Tax=Polycladidibacter stylochi TaxID=1807766 RepID=UPI000832F830|nr:hypothetical protein [Pseudovibrio stylochi]